MEGRKTDRRQMPGKISMEQQKHSKTRYLHSATTGVAAAAAAKVNKQINLVQNVSIRKMFCLSHLLLGEFLGVS